LNGQRRWAFHAGDTVSDHAVISPSVAADVVYFGTVDGTVYARHARTGAELWTTDTGSEPVTSTVAVAYGKVFVGIESDVVALDAGDGWFGRHRPSSTGSSTWARTTARSTRSASEHESTRGGGDRARPSSGALTRTRARGVTRHTRSVTSVPKGRRWFGALVGGT
jgi:outer membrane protein assembly factor BamB